VALKKSTYGGHPNPLLVRVLLQIERMQMDSALQIARDFSSVADMLKAYLENPKVFLQYNGIGTVTNLKILELLLGQKRIENFSSKKRKTNLGKKNNKDFLTNF
jgi:DNA repair protein RadC